MDVIFSPTCESCGGQFKLKVDQQMYGMLESFNHSYIRDNMLWLCDPCSHKKALMRQILSVAEVQMQILNKLENLENLVRSDKKTREEDSGVDLSVDCKDAYERDFGPYVRGPLQLPCAFSPKSSDRGSPPFSTSSMSSSSFKSVVSSSPSQNLNCSANIHVLKDLTAKEIKIDEEEKKHNVYIVGCTIMSLVERFKQTDPLFKTMFRRIYQTGSSFEGLRITAPTEFDVNCVLKLPLSQFWEVEHVKVRPLWAKYRFLDKEFQQHAMTKNQNESRNLMDSYYNIKDLLEEQKYLLPSKIKNWLQSTITKANISELEEKHVKKISLRNSGPALTLIITTDQNKEIDVDFVPVIEFSEWPAIADDSPIKNFAFKNSAKMWFLVPKDYNTKDNVLTQAETTTMWRIHFPEVEKQLLHNRGCVKPLIKLLKLLRDKKNWKFLASYYIKTLVMWEIINNPNLEEWQEICLPGKFMLLLNRLADSLDKLRINHIFFETENLLEKEKEVLLTNTKNAVKNIIKLLESDFQKNILKVFEKKKITRKCQVLFF